MRQVRNLPLAAALLVALGLGLFVVHREFAPALNGCRTGSSHMERIELLFGMGRKGGGEISEEEWRAFLDADVTPRFPDGLTVLTGYGQWRNASGAIAKETSRVLLIWARPDAVNNQKIETIRAAWKLRFAQESVMRVDETSCVSF
jgi:Protein of unknown function (DUF3574)